jgi:hypothetical protein
MSLNQIASTAAPTLGGLLVATIRQGSRWCVRILLIAVGLFSVHVVATGQDRLAYIDHGNRMEGLIVVPRNKLPVTLLSFSGYFEPFGVSDSVALRLVFYLPLNSEVEIVAQDLDGQSQYRMRSKPGYSASLGWNSFGPWPTSEVLQPAKLDSDSIGILAQLRTDLIPGANQSVAPVFLYHSNAPQEIKKYLIVFRPEYTQSSFEYEVLTGPGGKLTSVEKHTTGAMPVAGKEFEITLDTSKIPEGPALLRLSGQNRNREGGIAFNIAFYHRRTLRR